MSRCCVLLRNDICESMSSLTLPSMAVAFISPLRIAPRGPTAPRSDPPRDTKAWTCASTQPGSPASHQEKKKSARAAPMEWPTTTAFSPRWRASTSTSALSRLR